MKPNREVFEAVRKTLQSLTDNNYKIEMIVEILFFFGIELARQDGASKEKLLEKIRKLANQIYGDN